MASSKIIQFPLTTNTNLTASKPKPQIDGILMAYHFTDGSSSYDITGYFEEHPFLAIQASAGLGAIAHSLWTEFRTKK